MSNGTATERRVAKKTTTSSQPDPSPAFGRIELQASPEWIAELDAMAERMGMSRSAYIRMACNLKMAADRRQLGTAGDNQE